MTLNFWRMCTANLLLFISVYMLFPLLPFVMGEQLGVSVGQAGSNAPGTKAINSILMAGTHARGNKKRSILHNDTPIGARKATYTLDAKNMLASPAATDR